MLRDCLGEADEGLDLFTQSYFYTLAFCQTIKIGNLVEIPLFFYASKGSVKIENLRPHITKSPNERNFPRYSPSPRLERLRPRSIQRQHGL